MSSEEEGTARGQQDQAVWARARAQRNVGHHRGCPYFPHEESGIWAQWHCHQLTTTPPVLPQYWAVIPGGHDTTH